MALTEGLGSLDATANQAPAAMEPGRLSAESGSGRTAETVKTEPLEEAAAEAGAGAGATAHRLTAPGMAEPAEEEDRGHAEEPEVLAERAGAVRSGFSWWTHLRHLMIVTWLRRSAEKAARAGLALSAARVEQGRPAEMARHIQGLVALVVQAATVERADAAAAAAAESVGASIEREHPIRY